MTDLAYKQTKKENVELIIASWGNSYEKWHNMISDSEFTLECVWRVTEESHSRKH